MRELMVNNVTSVDEVARKTLIEGYTIGGKTGTAQIWDNEKGGWAAGDFNYTFCGFVGDGIPQLVIVVTVHKPALTNERRRLMVPMIESYEVFRRVAETSITVLDLPPDGLRGPGAPRLIDPSPPPDATPSPQALPSNGASPVLQGGP